MRQKTHSVSPTRWRYGILLFPLTSSWEDSRHVNGETSLHVSFVNFPPRHFCGENLNVIFAWPRTYLRRMVGLAWCPPHSGPSASNVKIWSCSDPCSVVQSNPRCLSIQQTRGDSNMIEQYQPSYTLIWKNSINCYLKPPPLHLLVYRMNQLISCLSSSRCSLIKTTVSGTGWRSAGLNQDQR